MVDTPTTDLQLNQTDEDIKPFFNTAIDPSEQPAPMDLGAAQNYAQTYDYALGPDSPGVKDIYDKLVGGQEDSMRESLSIQDVTRAFQSKQQKAADFIDTHSDTPLTEEQIQNAYSISNNILTPQQIDPASFMERKYADRVLDDFTTFPDTGDDEPRLFKSAYEALQNGGDLEYPSRLYTQPEAEAMRATSDFITKRMLIGKEVQAIEDKYKNSSWGSYAYDLARTTIPGYTWWMSKDSIEKTPDLFGDFSGNLKQQIEDIYSGKYTPEAAHALVKSSLGKLYESNPTLAHEISQKLLSYSDSDSLIDNASGVLDAYFLGDAARGVLKGAWRAATKPMTIAGLRDLSGNAADAALRDVIKAMRSAADNTGAAKNSLDGLFGLVPSLIDSDAVLKDAATTRFSTGAMSNISDMMKNYGRGLLKSTTLDPENIIRLPVGSEAYKVALEEAQDTAKLLYPRTNQNIMAIAPLRAEDDALTNNDIVQMLVGDRAAEPFYNLYYLRKAARAYGLKDWEEVPHGDGWAIGVKIPVDETLPTVKMAMRKHVEAMATPDTVQSEVINFFRAKDKFVPKDINQSLKVAAGGVSKLSSISRGILSREIQNLRKVDKEMLGDFLIHQQDNQYWSNTIGSFESDWLNFHGSLPNENQARMYFAMRQVNDAEWLVNNLRAYTLKSREGLMQHKFKLTGFAEKDMPNVEGKVLKEIPWDLGDDFGVLTWPNKVGTLFDYRRKVFTPAKSAMRVTMDDLVQKQGYKVVQVSKYGQEALRTWAKDNNIKNFPTGRLDYIIVKDTKAKPLDFQHIPHKPGGHFFYRDNMMIGQPKIVNSRWPGGEISNDYLHDVVWMTARTPKEANEAAALFEEARRLRFDANDVKAARAFVTKNLPMSYKEFTQAFSGKTAFLDPKTKIYAYPANSTIEDTHKISAGYRNFSNFGTSVHNVLNDNTLFRYGQERGARLSGVYNVGTQEQPIWRLQSSRLVDPYNAVRRANGAIMNARYMDDLKIQAADRYTQEFAPVLSKPVDELNRFPLRSLMDASLINKNHPDKALVAKAQNYRRAVLEFLQSEPQDMQRVHYWQQKAIGMLAGFDRQELALNWIEKALTSDPKAFMRYWAGFVPNMGLWNPKQLWMQAQGMTVSGAVEGWARTTKAAGAGWMMRGAMINGDRRIAKEAALKAAKYFGWKPKHFLESMDGLYNSHFWSVADNWADINDIRQANSVSVARNVADRSLIFFNKGERANKITAWNASYLRWREANPLLPFKGKAVQEVLNYADFLTMNMSRASSAANQANRAGWKGWASVATQFYSYHARLMDMVFGKELTGKQKLKLLTYNSLLYGAPIGVFGTAVGSFLQPSQAVRKFLDYEGWGEYAQNPVAQVVLNGFPQALINITTESDQNLAQTYGPSGMSFIPDLLGASDKVPDWLKAVVGAQGRDASKSDPLTLLLGASGSKVMQAINASSPIVGYILNTLVPGQGKPYTIYDFADLMSLTTPTNNAMRAWFAWNAGQYYTRQGKPILSDDKALGGFDAAMMAVFGTIPQDVADYYGKQENDKTRQEAQSFARQKAIEAYKRSMNEDLSDEDMRSEIDTAHKWMELGDLTLEQRVQVMREAYTPHLSRLETIERRINTGTHSNYVKWLNATDEGNRVEE